MTPTVSVLFYVTKMAKYFFFLIFSLFGMLHGPQNLYPLQLCSLKSCGSCSICCHCLSFFLLCLNLTWPRFSLSCLLLPCSCLFPSGLVWSCQVVNGLVWSCLLMLSPFWSFLVFSGPVCSCVAFVHGQLRSSGR